jgi:hypothetical protein
MGINLTLSTGSLIRHPFPDRSFTIVTSFRIMRISATGGIISLSWRGLLAEHLIVDFPNASGVYALEPLLFGRKKA